MIKNSRILRPISLAINLILLSPLIFEDPVHGENHFIKSLKLIRFDEKVKAQNFGLKDLNGNVVHLEDYKGKVVLLNFWATWCVPCLIEMPSMEKLYKEFKNRDFTILAVDMQEDLQTVKKFKEKFNLSFPILLDEAGVVANYYGVMGIPATYFIDREGFLYAAAMGARDWSSEDAVQLIQHLLDK